MRKLLAGLLSLCIGAGSIPLLNPEHCTAAQDHITGLKGSFIQPWLYAGWDAERWEKEMTALKATGIDTLIMGDVANHNTDGTWTVYYESELDFLEGYCVYNAIDSLFYYCDLYDIEVYLGMGLDCGWNSDLTTEEGRAANRAYMENCNQITTELYNRYKAQYPDTYHGFYFVTELFNTHYMETDEGIELYAQGLDEMFTMVLDNCNALNPEMPLLFSPYVNIFGYGFSCINADRFTEYWTRCLTEIPFRDGDMICPQDSCGGGGNDPEHLGRWMRAYREAVDRSNEARGTQLLLGTNAEMFVSPDAERMSSPHGVSYVGTKTVDDFTKRLEIAAPYVDELFCFAYSHHYSPYTAPPGLHEAFLHYLETGEIETNPPTPPTTVRTEVVLAEEAQHLQISIAGMTDDTAPGQINIYKDGLLYDYLVPNGNGAQNTWIDYEFDIASDSAVYEFEVVDVCGNASQKSSYAIDSGNLNNGVSLDGGEQNAAPAIAWEHDVLDVLEYVVTDSGVRIKGCDPSVTDLVIPDTIEGVPVTVIDWYAFSNHKNLRSVVLPETVTHISRYAFAHCISLEEINMPASLYAIEQYAFHDCPLLGDITLPGNLAIIEQRAFSECDSLTAITLPASCKTIGDYAFFDCESLSEVRAEGSDATFGTRSLGYCYDGGYGIQQGFVIDAEAGSTAAVYAEENGIPLKSQVLPGDVNADGTVSMVDVILLQKYLLGPEPLSAQGYANAMVTEDDTVDVFDLGSLKKLLI